MRKFLFSRKDEIEARPSADREIDPGRFEFERTYAPFSYHLLHLNVSMLSGQVDSDAHSTIIASMNQTGLDDYHRKRDAPNMGYLSLVVALSLLVLHCYHCPGMRMRRTLESPIAVHVVILEALEESVIVWEFQQRQQAKCIASQLNMIDINWTIASKILANKALRSKSKFELVRLHPGSGPCSTQVGHRRSRRRNRQRLLELGGIGESPNKRRMMQRNARSRLRSRISVARCT